MYDSMNVSLNEQHRFDTSGDASTSATSSTSPANNRNEQNHHRSASNASSPAFFNPSVHNAHHLRMPLSPSMPDTAAFESKTQHVAHNNDNVILMRVGGHSPNNRPYSMHSSAIYDELIPHKTITRTNSNHAL